MERKSADLAAKVEQTRKTADTGRAKQKLQRKGARRGPLREPPDAAGALRAVPGGTKAATCSTSSKSCQDSSNKALASWTRQTRSRGLPEQVTTQLARHWLSEPEQKREWISFLFSNISCRTLSQRTSQNSHGLQHKTQSFVESHSKSKRSSPVEATISQMGRSFFFAALRQASQRKTRMQEF